jgi:hypothetical protein
VAAVRVSATLVPSSNEAAQLPDSTVPVIVQSIPDVEDVTRPFPPPLPVTVSVRCGVALIVNATFTVRVAPPPVTVIVAS